MKNNTNSKGVNLVMFYINLKSILGKMRLHALTLLYNIFEPMDRDDGGGGADIWFIDIDNAKLIDEVKWC